MKTFFSAITKVGLAFIILIQKGDNEMLINMHAHLGLAFVALALVIWAIVETILATAQYAYDCEDDEILDLGQYPTLPHTPRRPPSNRELSHSAKFNALFENTGSFEHLKDRHR